MLLACITGLTYSFAQTFGEPTVRAIRTFLIPPNCPYPCWLDIRPGVTNSSEAIERLQESPWVGHIYGPERLTAHTSTVRWDWTAQTPDFVDRRRSGELWMADDKVYTIQLPLTLRSGDVQSALGAPDQVTVQDAPLTWPSVFTYSLYFDGTLELDSTILCPVTLASDLGALVDAHISIAPNQRALDDKETSSAICQ